MITSHGPSSANKLEKTHTQGELNGLVVDGMFSCFSYNQLLMLQKKVLIMSTFAMGTDVNWHQHHFVNRLGSDDLTTQWDNS